VNFVKGLRSGAVEAGVCWKRGRDGGVWRAPDGSLFGWIYNHILTLALQ